MGPSTILQEATGAIQPSCRRQQGPFTLPAGDNKGHSTILQEAQGQLNHPEGVNMGQFNDTTGGNRGYSTYRMQSTYLRKTTVAIYHIQPCFRSQQGHLTIRKVSTWGHLTILQEATGAIQPTRRRQRGGPFNQPAGGNRGHSTIL